MHKSEVSKCARDLGVTMIEAPLPQVVEELAHAVVADRRAGRAAPPALMRYIDLFAPDLPPSGESADWDGEDSATDSSTDLGEDTGGDE